MQTQHEFILKCPLSALLCAVYVAEGRTLAQQKVNAHDDPLHPVSPAPEQGGISSLGYPKYDQIHFLTTYPIVVGSISNRQFARYSISATFRAA